MNLYKWDISRIQVVRAHKFESSLDPAHYTSNSLISLSFAIPKSRPEGISDRAGHQEKETLHLLIQASWPPVIRWSGSSQPSMLIPSLWAFSILMTRIGFLTE